MVALAGKRLVFTGALSQTRAAMTKLASGAGAKVTGSVSKSTDIIVAADDAAKTAKVLTAKAYGTKVWSEKDFMKALKAAPKGKAKAKAKGRPAPKVKVKPGKLPSLKSQHAFLDHAKNKDFEKVMELVGENSAYVNVQPCSRWTALHQAAESGNKKVVKFLLDHKADVSMKTEAGQTPFDVAKEGVKAFLKVPKKRAHTLVMEADAPKLYLFEPMSAVDLAEQQGGWFAGEDEPMVEEGVMHLDVKKAPASARTVAEELQNALDNAYMPAGEGDCEGLVIVIANAPEDPKDACLRALAILETVDDQQVWDQATIDFPEFGDMKKFCDPDCEEEEDESEDENDPKIKKATKVLATKLVNCFHFNFEDTLITAPVVWGGYTKDEKHIVGVLGMRVWT